MFKISCILSYFIIKPQHFLSITSLFCCCILSYFIIKPQLGRAFSFGIFCCILSYFIIKPQRICCILLNIIALEYFLRIRSGMMCIKSNANLLKKF